MNDKTQDQDQSCSNCYFSDFNNDMMYNCRRNPPQMIAVPAQGGIAVQGFFPVVPADGWCGQWLIDPKKEKPPLKAV